MALVALTQIEVRTGGANTNGGGFAPGLGSTIVSGATDLATDSVNPYQVTSSTHSFVSGDVNRYIQVTAGTHWLQGYYRINSINGTAAILERPPAPVSTSSGTYTLYNGIDYGYQTSANSSGVNISTTDAGASGSTTITSSSANWTADIVGNVIYFSGGSGSITAQWRQCTGYTSSSQITIDTAIATSTNMTMNIGGALDSPGLAASIMVVGNTMHVQSGTYTISSATTNIDGGCVSLPTPATATAVTRIIGYGTSRWDYGTQPVFSAGSITSFTMVALGNGNEIQNVSFNGQSKTSSLGVNASVGNTLTYLCNFSNFTNNAYKGVYASHCVKCSATGCSNATVFNSAQFYNCIAYGNTQPGFGSSSDYSSFVRCISCNNTGSGSDGFAASGQTQVMLGCVAYGNGRDGFRYSNTGPLSATIMDCISVGNGVSTTGYGYNLSSGEIDLTRFYNCASYNNANGDYNSMFNRNVLLQGTNGFIICTASPFIAASSTTSACNFALNGTAGGGALLRTAGFSNTWEATITASYTDIGCAQHQYGAGFFAS